MSPHAAVLLFLPLFVPASAQEGREPSSGEDAGPRVLLEDRDGGVERRELAELDLRELAPTGAALLRFNGFEAPPALEGSARARVDLIGGGRLHAGLIGGEGEELALRLLGGTRLSLSIEEFLSLQLPERFPSTWTEPVEPAPAGDRLYRLRGGGIDRIDGTVEGFSTTGVTLESALGSKDFPWEEVAALFVEPLGEEAPASEGEPVVVDLVDGSRLPAHFRRLAPGGLDLLTRGGAGLRLPLSAVAEILVPASGVRFLSELEPVEAAPTSPFGDDLGMVWPWRRDLCTSGAPLRAGGRVWTRGLGVHAPSRLAYELGGEWRSLRAEVAIDDEVLPLPARGSVRFRVHGDGELLWESPILRGGDPPLAMPALSLEGVQRLELEVDPADEMHAGDRADWLRPILAR